MVLGEGGNLFRFMEESRFTRERFEAVKAIFVVVFLCIVFFTDDTKSRRFHGTSVRKRRLGCQGIKQVKIFTLHRKLARDTRHFLMVVFSNG